MTTAAEDSTTQIETDPAALALELDRHRAAGATVGLVPTMGALHDGHVALIERAAAETDLVVVSIFVNPLQFGEVADLDRYPRTLEADTALSGGAGAAVVFAPSVATMYPDGFATTVHVAGLTDRLEGAHRPGHFDGVTTVVAKLLAVVGRCRTYFGEKDFQQLQVVRRMVADLALPVEIVGCPTVRELDGLARSSRNARLTPAERAAAPVLHRALQAGAGVIERDGVAAAQAAMRDTLATEPLVATDYAEVVDPTTLQAAVDGAAERRFLVAARMGQSGTRLIDNL